MVPESPTSLCQKDSKAIQLEVLVKRAFCPLTKGHHACSEGVPFPCQKVMAEHFFSSWKVRLNCFFEMPCPLHKGIFGLYSLFHPCQKVEFFLYHCHGPWPLGQYRAQHEPEK